MNVAQQEWIGELPSGWDTVSLRDVLIERKELNKLRQETNILSVTNDRGVINYRDKGNVGNKASDDIERYKRVYRGDIVANSMNVIIGSVGISPEDGVLSPVYIVMKPADDVDTRFYDYIFKAKGFQAQLKRIGYGILDHRMRIPWDNLKIQQLPKPDYETQQKIADFLDTETAQIDNLIAKQERLLELLEEKRRATITHAVTRGLNPGVELKETNIPWLGQIPAHWSVVRVKDIADIVLGKMVQNEQKKTEEVLKPYLKSRNIQWNGIDLSSVDEMWFKPNEIQSYSLLDDDIVVSEGGDVGKCVMWREEFGEMYFQNSVNRVRVAENTEAKYVYYVFQHFALNQVFMNTVNKVSIAHLTKDKIATYYIPMPNEAEQRRIADYLDTGDTKFRELKQKIQTQITLLRERRTSLISHAVTGKVKV